MMARFGTSLGPSPAPPSSGDRGTSPGRPSDPHRSSRTRRNRGTPPAGAAHGWSSGSRTASADTACQRACRWQSPQTRRTLAPHSTTRSISRSPRAGRRSLDRCSWPPHRHVGNAVLDELVAVLTVAESAVPVRQVALGVQTRSPVADEVEGLPHQPLGQAATAMAPRHQHPTDPEPVAVVEDAEVRDRYASTSDPDVTGARLEITTVELCVGTLLFDHEDALPELPQPVRRARVEVVEPTDADVVRPGTRHAWSPCPLRNAVTWLNARRASGTGRSGYTCSSPGSST